MKKLYEKSELAFAIVCIVIYSILQSVANPLNKIIGIEVIANAILTFLITIILLCFIIKNKLTVKYGLKLPLPRGVSSILYLWRLCVPSIFGMELLSIFRL